MIEYILGWLTFFAVMTALGLMLIKGMQDAVERREQNEIYRLAQKMAENANVTVDAHIVIIDEMGGVGQ